MLGKLADVLDRDIKVRLQRLIGLLTPAITVILGVAVATIIASIMVAILGFAWLANAGHSPVLLALVIGVEALGVGLGTAAFVAYIAQTTHPLYTATQFALFTSLAAVPRTFANAATGYLVEKLGWHNFFILCFMLATPGMLLLLKIAPWNTPNKSTS